ncbi:biosynthetic peptidoglycan transglycosylase [Oscillospiraceae bacterium PP1C4]
MAAASRERYTKHTDCKQCVRKKVEAAMDERNKKTALFGLKFFILICISIVLFIAGDVFMDGYHMYKEALEQVSLEGKIVSLKADESYVEIEEVSTFFTDALVSVEDHRFYSHPGFDIIAIARAFISNITTEGTVSGGSTITQQLAKNMYFTFDKKYTRKVAELLVALQLECSLEKDEILELYINKIYFGNGYYGIAEASRGYFGVEPEELTMEQSVLLAGMPKAPEVFKMDGDPENLKNRSEQVVSTMVENNYLIEQQAAEVLSNVESIILQKRYA